MHFVVVAVSGNHIVSNSITFQHTQTGVTAILQVGLGILLAVWHSVSIVRLMNEVAVRWARLVLGWVTVFGRVYHLGM